MARQWDNLMLEGREGQQEALDNPEFADQQTADLMEFIAEERLRRDITLLQQNKDRGSNAPFIWSRLHGHGQLH